ncbi:hypothetical protein [Vagococcus lutrae]|uniref:hypothetical protein n=1 Tax=Vagococcus lutrae TaxID=81947 RepID=UPI002096EDDC|nr:hypothetical protein [Vagococcus lutrae]MCO7151748.1 hypothetical protein [Vagococcus lutrae]
MIDLLKTLTAILKGIHTEIYHDRNRKEKVVYPYATFDFDSEAIERNQEGFYLDIDMFDSNASYTRLFELEMKLKDGLIFRRELTNEVNLIFSFLGSNKVPTNDENLKRRNLRFYVKVDWRNK